MVIAVTFAIWGVAAIGGERRIPPCGINTNFHGPKREAGAGEDAAAAKGTSWKRAFCADEQIYILGVVFCLCCACK